MGNHWGAGHMSSVEDMDMQVEAEFVEEVQDILNSVDVLIGNLRSHIVKPEDGIAQIRRNMLNVEMRGATLDQPLVTIVSRRLAEYVSDLKTVDEAKLNDIQAFVDQLRSIMEGKVDVASSAKVVRALPSRQISNFNPSDVKISNVELLLVIPDKSTLRIVERELVACGYRTSAVQSPFQAFELAVRTLPDLVILAGVLGELSGVDLANAFAAMPATKDLKVAILTSYEYPLSDLPARVPIIRKGPQFGEDLADALSRLHIT
jgi:CheY-like chemotaxis protein